MHVSMNTTPTLTTPPSRSTRALTQAPTEDAAPDTTGEVKNPKHADKADKADRPNVPGVIRLLESGHFRGVADVRLRINFHEQLSERAAQNAAARLESGVDDLVATVSGETTALVESLQLDESTAAEVSGLLAEFQQTLHVEAEKAAAAGAIEPEALAASIGSAFADFTAALRDLLGGASPDPKPPDPAALAADVAPIKDDPAPPENEIDPAMVKPTPAEGGIDPLAALTGAFETALDGLMDAIGEAQMLPDPSPANGNGVAYAKFLAIYDALRFGADPPELDISG